MSPLSLVCRLLLVGLVLVLQACATPDVRLTVSSNAVLNQGQDEQSLPVVVRIYQLSGTHAFENASFDALWKDDLRALGTELVLREEITMSPAHQRTFRLPRHRHATHVAAVAVFREPTDEQWRAIAPLGNGFFSRRLSNSVQVSLQGSSIEVSR